MQVSLWGLRPPNHGETRVGRDSRQGHSGERAGAAHRVQEARVVPRGDPQPRAEERIAADPFVQQLEREFGAKVVSGSVRPA